jgi:NAD(P)H dehydrogenase (quinone)
MRPWDVEAARRGAIRSFLQPLDHPIPMVATADIAQTATDLLEERWQGVRVVELEGPRRYSAGDLAAGFSAILGRPVLAEVVARNKWETIFRAEGTKHPMARMRMLDGFNEGWIDFERHGAEQRTGMVEIESVLRDLVARS